jgi:hypothetical protein
MRLLPDYVALTSTIYQIIGEVWCRYPKAISLKKYNKNITLRVVSNEIAQNAIEVKISIDSNKIRDPTMSDKIMALCQSYIKNIPFRMSWRGNPQMGRANAPTNTHSCVHKQDYSSSCEFR